MSCVHSLTIQLDTKNSTCVKNEDKKVSAHVNLLLIFFQLTNSRFSAVSFLFFLICKLLVDISNFISCLFLIANCFTRLFISLY